MTNALEVLGMSAANALHTPTITLYVLPILLRCEQHRIFSVISSINSAKRDHADRAPKCQHLPYNFSIFVKASHFLGPLSDSGAIAVA